MSKYLCGECIHNSDKGGGCLIPKNLGYVDNCNRYLPKDRPIVQTNEEWLRSATTEELAYILRDTYLLGYTHGHNGADIHGGWSEWLKEKHK